MSIKFFIQWYQWVAEGKSIINWSEFDVINLSFERDMIAGDWNIDVALLGFGFHIHYMTKASSEYWADVIKENKQMKRWIYLQIWNLSEWSGIGLGKYAPYVFGKMIGSKGSEVDDTGKQL